MGACVYYITYVFPTFETQLEFSVLKQSVWLYDCWPKVRLTEWTCPHRLFPESLHRIPVCRIPVYRILFAEDKCPNQLTESLFTEILITETSSQNPNSRISWPRPIGRTQFPEPIYRNQLSKSQAKAKCDCGCNCPKSDPLKSKSDLRQFLVLADNNGNIYLHIITIKIQKNLRLVTKHQNISNVYWKIRFRFHYELSRIASVVRPWP